jgi:hypothetical protein
MLVDHIFIARSKKLKVLPSVETLKRREAPTEIRCAAGEVLRPDLSGLKS